MNKDTRVTINFCENQLRENLASFIILASCIILMRVVYLWDVRAKLDRGAVV